MRKLIAVLGVLMMLGSVAGCYCHPQEPVMYKGEG